MPTNALSTDTIIWGMSFDLWLRIASVVGAWQILTSTLKAIWNSNKRRLHRNWVKDGFELKKRKDEQSILMTIIVECRNLLNLNEIRYLMRNHADLEPDQTDWTAEPINNAGGNIRAEFVKLRDPDGHELQIYMRDFRCYDISTIHPLLDAADRLHKKIESEYEAYLLMEPK